MNSMRQIWNGILILLLILAVSFTICRSGRSMEFQHNDATLRKGDPDMPTLTLQVNMQRSEYLAGESLIIDLRLTNASDIPVEVPLADEESLFIYRLVSLEEKGPVYSFSQRQYEKIIDPETRIMREPEKQALPPGESADYQEDLARITTESVLPGRYRLEVLYPVGNPTVYASPKELVLKAPSILSFAPLVTRLENTIIWGFAHAHLNGSGSIFQRDSVKGHPELGVIYHRSDFEKKKQVSSLALSLDSPIRPGPRWIAWIEGAKLYGMFVWGHSPVAHIGPIDIKLDNPRLISPGRQFAEGRTVMDSRAVFLVAGRSGNRTQIAECVLPARADRSQVPLQAQDPRRPTPPISPGTVVTPAVMHHDLSIFHPEFIRVGYLKKGFRLVWNEDTPSDSIKIFSRVYGTGADDQSAELVYSTNNGKLVALEMPPLQEEGLEYVDALIEPVGEKRIIAYVRIPIDKSKRPAQWTFTKPVYIKGSNSDSSQPDIEVTSTMNPKLWAIPTTPTDQPYVLSILSDHLMMLEPTKELSDWTVVVESTGVASAEHLMLALLYESSPYGSRLWALWTNPTHGIQYCPIMARK